MRLKTALFCSVLGLTGTHVAAAPFVQISDTGSKTSLVESARSDCRWVDNKWTYQRGDKRLVCRPDRPRGAGWGWHREGPRYGWYNANRKEWRHNAW